MTTVFFICGNIGAGKTTYSRKLASQKNAVLFSIDPWMQNLYAADYDPPAHDFSWLTERVERCKVQIRDIAGTLIEQNIDIILDFGFGDIQSRDFHRTWAVSSGARTSLHFLDIPVEIRRERVHKRNREKGSTFSFEVTDEMFNYVEGMFLPPSAEELIGGLVVT